MREVSKSWLAREDNWLLPQMSDNGILSSPALCLVLCCRGGCWWEGSVAGPFKAAQCGGRGKQRNIWNDCGATIGDMLYVSNTGTKLDRGLLIKETQPYPMRIIHKTKDMEVISKNLVSNWIWKTEEKGLELWKLGRYLNRNTYD